MSVFARTDYEGPPLTKLTDVIRYVKPTALVGLSTVRVRVGKVCLFVDTEAQTSERLYGRSREAYGVYQYSAHHFPAIKPCVFVRS